MLAGNHHRIHPDRTISLKLYCYLRFTIGPQIRHRTVFPLCSQLTRQLMGQRNGNRHQFRRFVAGIAEHHSLIAGAGTESIVLFPLLDLQRLINT